MKKSLSLLLSSALMLSLLAGCGGNGGEPAEKDPSPAPSASPSAPTVSISYDVDIALSDEGITVDGAPISNETTQRVYAANDIVFYLEGQGIAYGEGTAEDEHTQAEADAHTVVHITQPGTYRITGTLSAGQIAVDLGEDAEKNPDAVVTLLLDGMKITSTVAPGIIFYNVYECGSTEEADAQNVVDTTAAGANVVIADDSRNYVNGSYVARIYKPDSVKLNAAGTEVEESKKLHKYDAAFYSKMSMNIYGGQAGTGTLNIDAENEGLDTELHLTIHGGNINIFSGNDGINTNEDGISVTTVNGGNLTIQVTGETGEGDGIDSNGWLVINGGRVISMACSNSMDGGIDSDMGIHINGGTVIATGHMLDRIEAGRQTFAVFQFGQAMESRKLISLQNEAGDEVLAFYPGNAYSSLIYSSPDLTEGTYTLWCDGTQFGHMEGMDGGMRPGGFQSPQGFEPGQMPQMPEGMEFPQGFEGGQGFQPPEGGFGGSRPNQSLGEATTEFSIVAGQNYFSGITAME